MVSSSGFGENKNIDVDPGLYIYTFFEKKNKQKEEVGCESKKWQESMGKVRHSSATDGDSVAAWVEPSEGVCVFVWGGGNTWLP